MSFFGDTWRVTTPIAKMSTQHRGATHKSATDTEYKVSKHAKLRFLERVNPTETFPAAAIRRLIDNGRPVRLHAFDNAARLCDGVAVVIDRHAREAITVLKPRPAQIEEPTGSEPDASAGWKAEYRHQGVHARGHQ